MPKRRRYGSIYQRKGDGRWVAAITTGQAPQTRRVAYARTKKQAQERLQRLMRGTYHDLDPWECCP